MSYHLDDNGIDKPKPKSPCAVCGTLRKNTRFWLCRECSVEWGCYKVPYRDWPEWVRYLVKETQRVHRREERGTIKEELEEPSKMERYVNQNRLI